MSPEVTCDKGMHVYQKGLMKISFNII